MLDLSPMFSNIEIVYTEFDNDFDNEKQVLSHSIDK